MQHSSTSTTAALAMPTAGQGPPRGTRSNGQSYGSRYGYHGGGSAAASNHALAHASGGGTPPPPTGSFPGSAARRLPGASGATANNNYNNNNNNNNKNNNNNSGNNGGNINHSGNNNAGVHSPKPGSPSTLRRHVSYASRLAVAGPDVGPLSSPRIVGLLFADIARAVVQFRREGVVHGVRENSIVFFFFFFFFLKKNSYYIYSPAHLSPYTYLSTPSSP
jgi:hypothetical protein